ncbi:MAG: hypothetical protein ACU0B9_07585 [Limimaricola soesokkakensis]|uniref:hypothetical protein n=2 Tax=Limimaricola soesokkakensis TaxID=1343159 RepID=UPI0040594607
MRIHPDAIRQPNRGVVLLATLLGVMLVAASAVGLQLRGASNAKVLAALERRHVTALDTASIRELLRARLSAAEARAGDLPPRDGSPVTLAYRGVEWEVRLNDIDGLVDLYLAPPEVLALLPIDGAELYRRREAMQTSLPPGTRYASERQTLARLGYDAATRAELYPLVTQVARTGGINPDIAPDALREKALRLQALDRAAGQAAELRIRRLGPEDRPL